jgi:hypothetical protein
MNRTELKAWIKRQLGGSFLQIELEDADLDDAVENAARWFASEKGVHRNVLVPVTAGQPQYTLPSDVEVVREVVFAAPPFDLSLIFSPFIFADERVPYDIYMTPENQGLYSTLTQTLQYIEMAKRTLSAESDWRVEEGKLLLSPVPRTSGVVSVGYKSNSFDIENLGETDHNFLKAYALAAAKWTLGRIRSKYDSYPVAGGDRQLDGKELIAEAKESLKELQEGIHGRQYGGGFLLG